ncbi:hypothetical protein [Methylopila sp. M107]|uniref:phage major capsid protein n=1 Tax=Methylopila sp. M107 TaxID=1101190 RepID=UPI00037E672F|nr:hypothetical protein [Methylopila sp. M107]
MSRTLPLAAAFAAAAAVHLRDVALIEGAAAAETGDLIEAVATDAALLESLAGDGSRFSARIIRAGTSKNGTFYSDAVLREAAALFEGVRVFVKPDKVHLAAGGKDPRNVLGRMVQVKFVEGSKPDTGELQSVFEALNPTDPMVVALRESVRRKMGGLFGFSIDARGSATLAGGVKQVAKIGTVNSVDLIVDPSAGGAVLDLLEAAADPADNQDAPMPKWLRDLIAKKNPKLLEGKDEAAIAKMSTQEIQAIFLEAFPDGAAAQAAASARDAQDRVAGVTQGDLDRAFSLLEARRSAETQLARSNLPESGRVRVMSFLEARADFSQAAVTKAIADELKYLEPFNAAGRVTGLGGNLGRIEVGETRAQKTVQMLEAFFDPQHRDHRQARSIKEIYVSITGDKNVTGVLRNCDQALLREAFDSTTLGDVLGDAITRRMVADYRVQSVYDVWRLLATVTPVPDFRTQKRTRMGGYGDFPIVAERAPYLDVTTPSDEAAEYAVRKRGGLESVSLEMIKNDDVGAIRRIPTRLSTAAKRTLSKFVLDFLRTNPVIYDGVALFHASHGNLFTSALSAAAVATHRLAMMRQAEAGSNDRLGVGPRNLWVPADLEEAAADIFRRNTNNDETFVQSLKPRIVPVWYWTDANDWCTSADTADIPTIEIGFLDGNEEPELLVQDSPTVGSMFTNDVMTWKLRHTYGGAVQDYRGLTKSVVP